MTRPDRRTLLTASAAGLAASLAGCRTPPRSRGAPADGPAPEAAAAPPVARPRGRELRKGLGLGMIGAGETVLEKFRLARACGFAGIELNVPGPLDIAEVVAARDATGLDIPSVVDSQHWQYSLGSPDADERKRGREGLEHALRDARTLGARNVLLVPAVVSKDKPYDVAWRNSIDEIRALVPLAEELGVGIAIENVWNNFILTPTEANRYLDEIGSDAVGWYLDLGNLLIYGWPEQWVRILGPRIAQLHVKEFSRTKMDGEGRWQGFAVQLGEGDNDWPAIMAALDDVGFRGWAVAEVGGGDAARLRDVSARMDRCFAG